MRRSSPARPHPRPPFSRFPGSALLGWAGLLITLHGGAPTAAAVPAQAEAIAWFEKEVRPILVEHCYSCHSEAEKIKGGLRLDTKSGWQVGGDTGPALVPHDAETSLLIRAITYEDRDLKMPPKKKMTEGEIATLREWIQKGAPDPREDDRPSPPTGKDTKIGGGMSLEEGRKFWSFQLPHAHTQPLVKDSSWPRNEIDPFILSHLESKALRPAPDAPAQVLLRRLSYDLTGLPPAAETLDRLADPEAPLPAADLERTVDQYLASPQFGERWGRRWLDLARFAESSGGGRTLPFKDAWRFRDYTVNSINQGKPLDVFITEQIAGDLLSARDVSQRQEQLIATGFLVLGANNYEEQDKGALRMDIVDEQMETIGKGLLGMTLGCARCHDHKFDPISARDYYAMAGILRSTHSLINYTDGVAHWVDVPLPLEGTLGDDYARMEARLAVLKAEASPLEKQLKRHRAKALPIEGRPLAVKDVAGIVVDDPQTKKIGLWKPSQIYPSYIGEGYLSDDNKNKGASTLTYTPTLPKSGRYEVRLAYQSKEGRATNVPVTILHADGEHTVLVNQTEPPPIDGRFISLGQYRFEKDGEGFVLISNTDTDGYVTADAIVFISVDDEQLLAANSSSSNSVDNDLKTVKKRSEALKKEIKELERELAQRPMAMSVREEAATVEDSPLHIRGSIRNLGEKVPRSFLSVAMYEPTPTMPTAASGRRELAAWITSDQNPLTARVIVNRVWMWLFDEGLVRSVENFGVTGELPSHPELLDTLAVDFMAHDWDLKWLVKKIVLSRAYQMHSQAHDAAAMAADPENRWLWRQNRKRLDAEAIRDAMLTVSQSLDPTMGGSTTPAGAVNANDDAAVNLEYEYVYNDTRRSLYTPAFRNKRLELFEVFDFADINQPIGRRHTSTIAPQGLYMMNHPFVMEQSRKAAQKILEAAPSDEEVVAQAYRTVLGRHPSQAEQDLSLTFLTVSGSDPEPDTQRQLNAALLLQSLIASLEFRYLH